MQRTIATLLVVGLVAGPSFAASHHSPTDRAGAEELSEWIGLADELIEPRFRREVESPHFRIVTDADEDPARLRDTLEAAFYAIDEVLDVRAREPEGRVIVYYFRTPLQLARLVGSKNPTGGFILSRLMVFYQGVGRESLSSQQIVGILLHECTHAFLAQFVTSPEVRLPLWVNEGLAEYMGHSAVVDGNIRPGVFYAKERHDWREGARVVPSDAAVSARELARWIKRGEAPALVELFDAGPTEFYDQKKSKSAQRSRRHYTTAWAFIHYLRHGREGEEPSKSFSALLQRIASGDDGAAALRAVYGVGPADMQAPFERYVRETLSNPPEAPRGTFGAPGF